jgi:hypothetical protein
VTLRPKKETTVKKEQTPILGRCRAPILPPVLAS